QLLVRAIKCGPIRPAIFATYTELVEGVCADDAASAQRSSDQLLGLHAPSPGTRIVTLDDGDLGPHQSQRYARLIDDDPGRPLHIRNVADKASAIGAIVDALDLLDAGVPALAVEIRDLTREIVVAEGGPSPITGKMTLFDGASTFYLWGCIFANATEKSR